MSHILVVDDDDMIREHLARLLRQAGLSASTAADGIEALGMIAATSPDLVVLDVLMPRSDGREVLRTMRRRGDWTPVILLTGVGESTARADALEEGADDYLNKPFDPAELLARIRAVLRRGAGPTGLVHAPRITGGGITIDRIAKHASARGRQLALTPKALALLEFLMVHHGETFSREQLLAQVWGIDIALTTRAVDHRVAELRKVLTPIGIEDSVETVQGIGYRFYPAVEVS